MISRNRRTVLQSLINTLSEDSKNPTHLRTVAAAVVVTVHAPPAIVFLHALQCQIPTAVLFTESYQWFSLIPGVKVQTSNKPFHRRCRYIARVAILPSFLPAYAGRHRNAVQAGGVRYYTKQLLPLTVPYLPVIPTFFVRFVCMQILRTIRYTGAWNWPLWGNEEVATTDLRGCGEWRRKFPETVQFNFEATKGIPGR